ncbi:MAG: hypothetical protein JNM36_05620 [Chitinophagales bacterium]|nr:hypothetical protein [Chitinophagales bacterium]
MNIHEKKTKLEFAFSLQTKDNLLRASYPLAVDFVRKYDILCRNEGVTDTTMRKLLKKNPTKEDIVEITAVPYLTKALFVAFREELPPSVRKILDELIWVESLHESTIRSEFGIEITTMVKTAWSYERVELKPKYYFFSFTQGYSTWSQKSNITLSLVPFIRQVIAEYYDRPLYYHFIDVTATDLECSYRYESGEINIFNELARLTSYYMKGNIKTNARNVPTPASVNKMVKALELKEFFTTENALSEWHSVRSNLLAQIMVAMRHASIMKDHLQTLRNILIAYQSGFVTMYMLPNIKIPTNSTIAHVEKVYLNLFAELPLQEWVRFENIVDYARFRTLKIKPTEIQTYNPIQYLVPPNSTDKYNVTDANFHELVTIPCLQHACFLMAALGILNIGYNEPSPTAHTLYASVAYVQLTPLGSFLFGKTKEYQAPEYYKPFPPILAEDSLTLMVDEKDDSAELNLQDYVQKIGKIRYRTSHTYFIANCRTTEEVLNKVIMFKSLLSDSKIPPNWEVFFESLLNRAMVFKTVEPHTLLQIPANNNELIQLVVHDPQLKNIVTKAENFILLIPNRLLPKFKNRMRELGYVVE